MKIHRDLFDLLQDYVSLTPARLIKFPSHVPFPEINSGLVHHILLNPVFQTYPPSKQYQRSFWKFTISHLEILLLHENGDDQEIDSRILDHYLSIFPSPAPVPGTSLGLATLRDQLCDRGLPLGETPSKSFVTHFWEPCLSNENSDMVELDNYQSFTLEESRTMIESGTTGLRTWFTSNVLAGHLIRNPSIVQGKRVLELGSGVGFLGTIIASLQQLKKPTSSSIWLTDVNQEVLTQCQHLSSGNQDVHFQLLDWDEALKPDVKVLEELLQHINPDVIICADVIFDPAVVPSLVALLVLALKSGSRNSQTCALISQTVRNTKTFQGFLDCAQDHRLLLQDVEIPSSSNPRYFVDPVEAGLTDADVRTLDITLDESNSVLN
ncbi:hypothetical protein D9757_002298 [Collybiopsis confluens]|uniref:Uncharacterized protein n=1 Tax=Collybiopsis confluens TaxID=2823264 RepID=A0A8H5I084_9AGAR|nr:hypothetical protein D9757_002298 [Collybiopsis confluens]